MKRKKVLLLNTSFKYEGPNDVLWVLARHVDTARYEPLFGCMHEGGPMEKHYRDLGFQTRNFGMKGMWDLGTVFRVRDFVRSERVDLAMVQLLRAETFGGLGVRLAGVPLVAVVHNSDPYRASPGYPVRYALSRLSMGWPSRFVAVSDYVRDFVCRHQGVKRESITTIHNAVDAGELVRLAGEREAVRAELGLGPDDLVLGTAARFTPQKGLMHLLEAFGRLSPRHPGLRLVLVGDGPEMTNLKRWCDKEETGERVQFTGFRSDCKRLIQGFDIYVMSSIWEGLPMMLLSAMASSKPTVATAVAGIPEVIIDGRNGFLVPPADPGALASAVERLVTGQPGLRESLGAEALRRVERDFSPESMARKYEKVWEECISNG